MVAMFGYVVCLCGFVPVCVAILCYSEKNKKEMSCCAWTSPKMVFGGVSMDRLQ